MSDGGTDAIPRFGLQGWSSRVGGFRAANDERSTGHKATIIRLAGDVTESD